VTSLASVESFPAATTNVMPESTALQIAACIASPPAPQLPVSSPAPPRLMFATSISSALAAT